MTKVFIESPTGSMVKMFENWDYTVVKNYKEADIIVFEGGTDICSALYGQAQGDFTQSPDLLRDMHCVHLYNYARVHKLCVIGICRGAQFITAMQGGKLIQHIENHPGPTHKVFFDPGSMDHTEPDCGYIEVTSDHHQAMVPHKDIQILAKSEDDIVEITWCDDDHFSQLCVQGHPEWASKDSEFQKWFMNFVDAWMVY